MPFGWTSCEPARPPHLARPLAALAAGPDRGAAARRRARGPARARQRACPRAGASPRELGLSRGVVVEAYAQLAAEGYLVTRQGGQTRVAPMAARQAPPEARLPDPRPPRFDFRPGGPDVSLFPRAAWLASIRRALRDAPDSRLDYGDPRGAPELRRALASYLGRVRGVAADPECVVVTSGMAQGMALFGRALVAGGGRRIAVEDPWSAPGRRQLESTGLDTVPVPVDEDGVRVDALAAERADAVAVTPAHQFPLGVVLSAERRFALVDWAARTGAFVLEDDYDAEYRYDRQPVGAVQGLAPELVAYAGSISKTLAPGLRIGWMVAPGRLVDAVAERQAPRRPRHAGGGAARACRLPRARRARSPPAPHPRRLPRPPRRARGGARAAACRAARVGGVAAGLHLVMELPDADGRGRRRSPQRARRGSVSTGWASTPSGRERPRCCSATAGSPSRPSTPACGRCGIAWRHELRDRQLGRGRRRRADHAQPPGHTERLERRSSARS